MLDEMYMQILDMSKVGSIVILVVVASRLLLRNAPKVFSYALWAVVLLRLLCPISFGHTTVSLVPEILPTAQNYTLSDEPITVLEAGNAALQAVGDALNGGLGIQIIHTTEVEPDGTLRTVTTDWYDVWILFGQYVWAAGVIGLMLYSAISYHKLRRKLKEAVPLRENIYLAEGIQSPCVVGIIHPKVYLPSNLSEKEQSYIILHEQYHIRRYDHIVKLLAFLALCLHWFNPLVWAAFHLASKDMEMSCDEAVVRKMGPAIRADYAASLLALATGRRIIAGNFLAFGEGDPKGRIRNLAKWKKPAIWVTVIAVILCSVLAVCLLTDPPAAKHTEGETWYYGTVADNAMSVVQEGDRQGRAYITLHGDGGEARLFWQGRYAEDPGDILGKHVVVRGCIEEESGLLIYTSVRVTDPMEPQSLEAAIHTAILAQNQGSYYPKDGMPFTSFVQLAVQNRGDKTTLYGLALYQEYGLHHGVLVEGGASHVPVALTFYRSDTGAYVLSEYWEPRDGSYYADDIRAEFPAFVWPDTQEHIEQQLADCYAQAVAYFGLDASNGIINSSIANDFEIKLYADQDTYTVDEAIHIWATLEYQGPDDTVTIWHGLPFISFSIAGDRDFRTGGLVATVLTSTELERGEIYHFDFAKSGGYGEEDPDAAFWREFYQDKQLHLPAGTYTITVNGAFSMTPEQRPGEGGPSCSLEITVTE